MTYSPYTGDFTCWADVTTQFSCAEPEPDEVLIADYENGGYDGRAHVVYRNGPTYYVVEGSHCSCYGLEGQFEPEAYDVKTFIEAMKLHWGEWPKTVLARIG